MTFKMLLRRPQFWRQFPPKTLNLSFLYRRVFFAVEYVILNLKLLVQRHTHPCHISMILRKQCGADASLDSLIRSWIHCISALEGLKYSHS